MSLGAQNGSAQIRSSKGDQLQSTSRMIHVTKEQVSENVLQYLLWLVLRFHGSKFVVQHCRTQKKSSRRVDAEENMFPLLP